MNPKTREDAMMMTGIILIIIVFCLLATVYGCAAPSKLNRCQDLLSEARRHGRECHRILKEYESSDCKAHPAQDYDAIDMGVAGFK